MKTILPSTVHSPDFQIMEEARDDWEFKKFMREYLPELQRRATKAGTRVWHGAEHPTLAASLVALARRAGARNILEVGVQCGGSALGLLKYCQLTESRYTGVESFSDEIVVGNYSKENWPLLQDWAEQLNPGRNTFLAETFDSERFYEPAFDFVFLDHFRQFYLGDLENLYENGSLTDGAWVALHDVAHTDFAQWPDIKAWVLDNNLGSCTLLDEPDSIVRCPDTGLIRFGKASNGSAG